MKVTKRYFKDNFVNAKNIKIISIFLVLLLVMLLFSILRDTGTLVTHKQANTLFTEDKIQKVLFKHNSEVTWLGSYVRHTLKEEEK